MADYIPITEAQSDPEAAVDSSLIKRLRDNPIAMAEGAAGAPLISGALTKVVDQQEIGTFIFARGPSTTDYGSVVSGSSLTYAGAISSASATTIGFGELISFSISAGASGSPSGSWVCLGRIEAASSGNSTGTNTISSATAATLWQRVA